MNIKMPSDNSEQQKFDRKLLEEVQKVPLNHRQVLWDTCLHWHQMDALTLKFHQDDHHTALGWPTPSPLQGNPQLTEGMDEWPRLQVLSGDYSQRILKVLYHCQEKQENINGTRIEEDRWIYLNDILDYVLEGKKESTDRRQRRNLKQNSILNNLSVLKFVSVDLKNQDPFWCLLDVDEPVKDAEGNLQWHPPHPHQPVKDHRGELLFRFRLNLRWAKRLEILHKKAVCSVEQLGITPEAMHHGPAGAFPMHWLLHEAQIVQHLDAGELEKAQTCVEATHALKDASEAWSAFEDRIQLLRVQLLFRQGEAFEAVGLFNELEKHMDPDLQQHWCYFQAKYQVKLSGQHTLRDLNAFQQELQKLLDRPSLSPLQQARLQLVLAQVQQKRKLEAAENHAVNLALLAHLTFLTEHHLPAAEHALLMLAHLHHLQSIQHRPAAFLPWGHSKTDGSAAVHPTEKQLKSLQEALDCALWLWENKPQEAHRNLDGRLPVLLYRILADLNARHHQPLLLECMQVLINGNLLWNKLHGYAIRMRLMEEGLCEDVRPSSLETLKRLMSPRVQELHLKPLMEIHPPLAELLGTHKNKTQGWRSRP